MAERQHEAFSHGEQAGASGGQTGNQDETLRAMLDAARTEADQQRSAAEGYLNLAQRVQADFVNYKRRVETEREAQADAVRAETIRAFLPVVDDLERALSHVPRDLAEQGWVEGFLLIQRNLASAFERLGVRRVGEEGEPFDPNVHEAVTYEEHPTLPEGHVATVHRPGYQLGERVVRPAQVAVSRAAAQTEPEQDGTWAHHEGPRGHDNGGVKRADLRQPRHIERAESTSSE